MDGFRPVARLAILFGLFASTCIADGNGIHQLNQRAEYRGAYMPATKPQIGDPQPISRSEDTPKSDPTRVESPRWAMPSEINGRKLTPDDQLEIARPRQRQGMRLDSHCRQLLDSERKTPVIFLVIPAECRE